MAQTDPATEYRHLIRENYRLSALRRASRDLDERLAIGDEIRANEIAARHNTLDVVEKGIISNEEFKLAFPKTRESRRTGKSNPWQHRTSGRAMERAL